MTREYANWTNQAVREHLQQLLDTAKSGDHLGYRESMRSLGHDMGERLRSTLPLSGDFLVVMTVEDADFLGRGVIEALKAEDRVKIFCYWNERDSKRDVAPIVSRYEEPIEETKINAVIVLKSIISGACVVRTNLIEALDRLHHSVPVYVLAPVMFKSAKSSLRREFPKRVADRFRYITCAFDGEKDGENVKPGIGGSVYELLGLGDKNSKNRIRPKLIEERC